MVSVTHGKEKRILWIQIAIEGAEACQNRVLIFFSIHQISCKVASILVQVCVVDLPEAILLFSKWFDYSSSLV